MKYYAIRRGKKRTIIAGEWRDVEGQIKSLISGVSFPEWKGFKTRAEAEAYMNEGQAANSEGQKAFGVSTTSGKMGDGGNEELPKYVIDFEFSTDAVAFVDGSCNFNCNQFDRVDKKKRLYGDGVYYSSYGMVIFFKDGTIYVESAKIEDADLNEGGACSYTLHRTSFLMDERGNFSELESRTQHYDYVNASKKSDRYALASWNVVGEVEGAMRALDFCLNEKGLQSIDVIYDCDQVANIKKVYNLLGGKTTHVPKFESNVTYRYGEMSKGLYEAKKDVRVHHIYSHQKGIKAAIFNDCADVLAKAETFNNPIGVKENPNLMKYQVKSFDRALSYTAVDEEKIKMIIEERRQQAYALIRKVLQDETVWPKFRE